MAPVCHPGRQIETLSEAKKSEILRIVGFGSTRPSGRSSKRAPSNVVPRVAACAVRAITSFSDKAEMEVGTPPSRNSPRRSTDGGLSVYRLGGEPLGFAGGGSFSLSLFVRARSPASAPPHTILSASPPLAGGREGRACPFPGHLADVFGREGDGFARPRVPDCEEGSRQRLLKGRRVTLLRCEWPSRAAMTGAGTSPSLSHVANFVRTSFHR